MTVDKQDVDELRRDRERHRDKRDAAAKKVLRFEKVKEAQQKLVDLRTRQIAKARRPDRPRLITAAEVGLQFSYVFGPKGAVVHGAGHYTAGPRAKDPATLRALARQYHAYHASLGWGGLSYEALIGDDGTILLGNPTDRKSAAVAAYNTGMVNICCPGTTGDRMTGVQLASVKWLLANWHTSLVPAPHRLARPAREVQWKGHHEWPGQSTACPGAMLEDYRRCWR
jgi:hypothetical protein